MTRPGRRGTEGVSIHEVDRLVARFVWLERRRFEILGSWVTSVPESEVAVLLAAQARHHAWHASLWEQHLPRRSGYQAPAEPPASEALSAFLDALAGPPGTADTVARLSGAFRVLGPQALASYGTQLDRATSVSDAAWARTCRLVLSDQRHDGFEGGRMLSSLLATDQLIEQAARHQAELERLLLDAGGIAG